MNLWIVSFLFFSSAQASVPIIGGENVQSSDLISQTTVALISQNQTGQALCTASLVAQDLAITAAHCVKDGSIRSQLILAFNVRLQSPSALILRGIDRVEVPTEWKPNSSSASDTSDVALVHFTGGLPSGYQAASLLPFEQTFQVNQEVVIAGFGITDANSNSGSGDLRKTKVRVKNPNYSPSEIEFDQSRGGGACHGDSGGPAFVMINERPYLFGITSRGGGECNQEVIYTKISAYSEWFKAAVRKIRN